MNAIDYATCAYCPRLCRHVCPVAVGSGREAATPAGAMTGPWLFLRGHLGPGQAGRMASLCTGCGACEAACKHRRPVPRLLAQARATLLAPPPVEEPGAVEGEGELVAVLTDDRDWAPALAGHLQRPVARLRTQDQLGAALLDHPARLAGHAARLRASMGERTLVTADQGVHAVAAAAGLACQHLAELLTIEPPGTVHHPCQGPRTAGPTPPDALACCGARHPLLTEHPDTAALVGREAARRLQADADRRDGTVFSPDTRCADWLRRHGARVTDPVAWLLARPAGEEHP